MKETETEGGAAENIKKERRFYKPKIIITSYQL